MTFPSLLQNYVNTLCRVTIFEWCESEISVRINKDTTNISISSQLATTLIRSRTEYRRERTTYIVRHPAATLRVTLTLTLAVSDNAVTHTWLTFPVGETQPPHFLACPPTLVPAACSGACFASFFSVFTVFLPSPGTVCLTLQADVSRAWLCPKTALDLAAGFTPRSRNKRTKGREAKTWTKRGCPTTKSERTRKRDKGSPKIPENEKPGPDVFGPSRKPAELV